MKAIFDTDLNCGACVAKVTPFLDELAEVESWHVDTTTPSKRLTVELADASQESMVVDAVRRSGFNATIATETTDASGPALVSLERPSPAVDDGFRLSRYKPLLLVVAYVLGGSLFLEAQSETFEWMQVMRYFMGLFFLGFAFFKLLDVGNFADAFRGYDIVAKRSRAYAVFYPFLELGLGLAFLFGVWPLASNVLTGVVMAVGLIGVVSVVRRGQVIQCACLGTAFDLPMSVVTIIENSVMLVMAVFGALAAVEVF